MTGMGDGLASPPKDKDATGEIKFGSGVSIPPSSNQ
jgi:hypothetical protein